MKNVTVFLSVLLLSVPAFAASCYSPKEVEAEQGVRILSELMVIGLNCQHLTPKGQENLYNQYKRFSLDHEDLFGGYEKTLLGFYRKAGKSNPEGEIHKMRTSVANRISQDAARMRPDAFCAAYAPRISKARAMPESKIRQWAQTVFPGFPVSHKTCGM